MAETVNLKRGWLTTTRFEIINWTLHGTNYFPGPQSGLGPPHRINAIYLSWGMCLDPDG